MGGMVEAVITIQTRPSHASKESRLSSTLETEHPRDRQKQHTDPEPRTEVRGSRCALPRLPQGRKPLGRGLELAARAPLPSPIASPLVAAVPKDPKQATCLDSTSAKKSPARLCSELQDQLQRHLQG